MSNALTLDIRFKGFADDWEQCKLGDIGKTYGGLSGKSKEDFGHGDARFVTYMNVFSNPVGDPAMTEAIELDGRQNEVKKGDIFFTTSSETPEEVGMSCVWMENMPNTYLNSFCFGYRPIVELDLYYLAYVLRSSTVRHKFIFLAQGISRYNISKNKAMEMLIPVPNMEEQVHLGAFFKDLDNLITLHQKELEKLIDIKKSMLINMFPQGDEKVPRIRFKGFSGDWNYPVLGTLGKTYTGLSGKTKEDFGNGYATYITYMNVFTNPITNPSQVDSIESDAMQNEVQEGDIFFTTSSETPEEVGMSSVLLAKSGTTYLNSFCFGYRLNENVKIDKYYLAYLLRSPVVREKIVFLAQGISRFNISKTKMMEIAIPVPEKTEEQEKIGAFFFNLDKLIEAQEKKIAQLKNIKSALLNKMFPKGDE